MRSMLGGEGAASAPGLAHAVEEAAACAAAPGASAPAPSVAAPTPNTSAPPVRVPTPRPRPRDVVPAAAVERDALLLQLALLRQGLVLPLAEAAFALSSQSAWLACGCRNAEDLSREGFQRTGRWLRNLVRLHGATERLPGLRAAVAGADGYWPLGQMAALCIARVATELDVGSWIEEARRTSLDALRQAVKKVLEARGQRASDTPEEEPEVEERVLWRLDVPPEVALAHEAVRDLQRAVAGRETGLEGFVEAVTAEVEDRGLELPEGFHPRFVRRNGAVRGKGKRAELRHEGDESHSVSRDWVRPLRSQRVGPCSTPGMRQAEQVLAEFEQLETRLGRLVRGLERTRAARASVGRIRRLVVVLGKLVRLENRLEVALGDLLAEQQEDGGWGVLGYGNLESYAQEHLGLGRTAAWGRASLARKLRHYPEVRDAYASGRLGYEKAQIVVRMLRGRAGADPVPWIEAASRTTVRRLRQEERWLRCETLQARLEVAQSMTRGHGGGAEGGACDGAARAGQFPQTATAAQAGSSTEPGQGCEPEASACVGQFPQPATTAQAGSPAELGAAAVIPVELGAGCGAGIGERAGQFPSSATGAPAGSSAEPGAECGAGAGARAGQVPRGLPLRLEPLDDATWRESLLRVPGETQEALCGLGFSVADRVVRGGPLLPVTLDFVLSEELAAKLRCWIEAARRKLSEQPELSPADESRLWPAERIALDYVSQGKRVPEWVGYLVLLQVCAAVWDVPPEKKSERDSVAERDGWHCMAPGCTARADLQRHHLVYRSHGGGDEDENILLTCVVHHQLGEHGGQARCRGRAPLSVIWRLGCAALGTWWLNDRRFEKRR